MTPALPDLPDPQARPCRPPRIPEEPTSLVPYLTSVPAGWDQGLEGLRAVAFVMPRELESHVVPAGLDVILKLYAGGPLRVERRKGLASWAGGEVHAGDLFLSWGAPYEARAWSLSALPSRILNLRLSRELVARAAEEGAGVEWARLEPELAERPLAGIHDPLLLQLAHALWRELEQPAPAGRLYAEAAAQLLAAHLLRRYACAPAAPGARGGPWASPDLAPCPAGLSERQLARALEYIRAHLGEDLSLGAVARQIGFSPYHFARLFRRATGAGLHQVVLRERVAHARRLLAGTGLPLANVAVEAGFADQSHLTLVFRRHLGLTPRAFRQEGRGEHGDGGGGGDPDDPAGA
jgi:AraC family transcriptional regulator